jgi:glycosyltransferase involved in cell wall biosynthesis
LRIAHYPAPISLESSNGVETHIRTLAFEQARSGHAVTLVPRGRKSVEGSFVETLRASAIAVASTEDILLGRLQIDVLHLHSVNIPVLLLLTVAGHMRGATVVATPHGGFAPAHLGRRGMVKRLYQLFVERLRFALTDRVVAVSKAEAAALVANPRLGIKEDKVEVVNNFIEATEDSRQPDYVQRRLLQPVGERFQILFVGRLTLDKGIDRFLEIARHMPDCEFTAVGPRTDRQQEEGDASFHLDRPPGNAVLPGPLFGDEKIETLRKADLFVLPSRTEGFSMAMLEAASLGIPIAITDGIGGSAELVEAGAAILLGGDSLADAHLLMRVLNDRCRRKELSEMTLLLLRRRWLAAPGALAVMKAYER